MLKVNSDAACRPSSTGIGLAIKDSRGDLKVAKSIHISRQFTPLLVEIKGILEAVKLARSRNYLRIVVE